MYKTCLRIALRNLTKSKTSSVINIGVLAVGMTVAILIGLGTYDFLPIPVAGELKSSYGRDFTHVIMSSGPNFSAAYATDSAGFVINEAAAKYMGLSHAAGQTIRWDNDYEKVHGNYRILGVVKDMVMNSPFEKVKQTLFRLGGGDPHDIIIRLNPRASVSDALPKVEAVLKKLIPLRLLNIHLQTTNTRSNLQLNISQMLSLDFVKLVIVSCGIAVPIAWFYE